MAKVWELLDQAYYLIGKKRYAEARSILDEILRMNPQNVDAWNAYMGICTTRRDLEGLKNYIATIWDTQVRDQDYLHATQRFVLHRVDEKMNSL
jgi:tetratricopeptide (TPR) repeat protein